MALWGPGAPGLPSVFDLAVRYGGDEFRVVLIDADKAMTEQVARRIQMGLRDPASV